MKLRRLWIILHSGLRLFDYIVRYCEVCGSKLTDKEVGKEVLRHYCEQCGQRVVAEPWSFGAEDIKEQMMDTSALAAFLRFFEIRFAREFGYFTFEDILFANFKADWTYYKYERGQQVDDAEKVKIRYRVLALAERDLSIPLLAEVRILTDFCNVINLDFYQDFAPQLATLVALELEQFTQFRYKAESAVFHIDTISEELKKRLEQLDLP